MVTRPRVPGAKAGSLQIVNSLYTHQGLLGRNSTGSWVVNEIVELT